MEVEDVGGCIDGFIANAMHGRVGETHRRIMVCIPEHNKILEIK
jgi:hypothetical protein